MPDLTFWKDLASIVAVGVAMASMIIALNAYLANRRNQRDTIIQGAYADYLKMALENADLAFPRDQKLDLDKQQLNDSGKDFERYEWFVSSMLSTVYLILEVQNDQRWWFVLFSQSEDRRVQADNKFWREMIENQIAYHWQYLSRFRHSKLYLKNWDTRLRTVIDEGIRKGQEHYPPRP
jgi:hypothetical protein